MTFNKIASLVAKKEGKKNQARIGEVREILSILVALQSEHILKGKYGPLTILHNYAGRKAVSDFFDGKMKKAKAKKAKKK